MGFGGEPAGHGEPLGDAPPLRRRAWMLPELDLSRLVGSVDADVRLDEAGDEHRRRSQVCRHGLELPEPTAGVDEGAAFAVRTVEVGECRRMRVPGDEDPDLGREGIGESRGWPVASRLRISSASSTRWWCAAEERMARLAVRPAIATNRPKTRRRTPMSYPNATRTSTELPPCRNACTTKRTSSGRRSQRTTWVTTT